MLRSWHNFFFVSLRPQRLHHRRQAAAGALASGAEREALRLLAAQPADPRGGLRGAGGGAAVPDRRAAVRRDRGRSSSAFALAVFPSFVAVVARQRRRPAADPADARRLRRGARGDRFGPAAHADRGAPCSSVLAFNTKSLAALLCVPGIAAGYLVCAPGSLRRRVAQLAAAGACWSSSRLVVARRRSDAGVAAAVRRRQHRRTPSSSSTSATTASGASAGSRAARGRPTQRCSPRRRRCPLVRPGVNSPPSPARAALLPRTAGRRASSSGAAARHRAGASARAADALSAARAAQYGSSARLSATRRAGSCRWR